uniref:Im:7136021 n=1 Tax=Lepisosteus oculatus TaxID=7918 RepID=W5N002_LEPOC|nr:PREDICTED: uncharacterized protein LOC107077779 [Lepisosteus oculatus]XP_015206062.1 PREDICTED: uncharacterized protein LOC107077779 [Lepisosteus oculatus]XP_015206063.1 PREDICTED: uncharacterized protein LOC107077779 [Lepisosteus oculatus]
MPVSALQLPQEVWVHVFSFLTDKEKGDIRATCRYFRRLIDLPSLWKSSPAVVKRISAGSSGFWTTLRRRRTGSVLVKAGVTQWEQLATSLPWLTALAIEQCRNDSVLQTLQRFRKLKRLVMRGFHCTSTLPSLLAPLQQLTHLTLCEPHCSQTVELIAGVSQLTNLRSLVFHEGLKPIPKQSFQDMLGRLPHLKELSLKVETSPFPLPADYFALPRVAPEKTEPHATSLGLTRLELLNYRDSVLSQTSIEQLSSLQSLAIYFHPEAVASGSCHLETLVRELPCLTELTVARGYPFSVYVRSIPPSLKSLSLSRVAVSAKDMKTLGSRTAGLRHLQMDMCTSDRQWSVLDFPQFFPQLRTLQLRHCNVAVEELVGLAKLRHLEKVAVLDAHLCDGGTLQRTFQKLKSLTDNRLQILHSLLPLDPMACSCARL